MSVVSPRPTSLVPVAPGRAVVGAAIDRGRRSLWPNTSSASRSGVATHGPPTNTGPASIPAPAATAAGRRLPVPLHASMPLAACRAPVRMPAAAANARRHPQPASPSGKLDRGPCRSSRRRRRAERVPLAVRIRRAPRSQMPFVSGCRRGGRAASRLAVEVGREVQKRTPRRDGEGGAGDVADDAPASVVLKAASYRLRTDARESVPGVCITMSPPAVSRTSR